MIAQSKEFLLATAEQWHLPRTGEWRFLLHNNYQPQNSNVNLLWFHEADPFPRVVTKIFREPEIPKREFENLTQVYQCAPRWVPKPWHFGLQGEFWMLWMEGVPGSRFGPHNNFSPDNLTAIVDILAQMHNRLRKSDEKADLSRYRRVVSEPVQILARFGAAASVQEGCKRMLARSGADWLVRLPIIPQHGDLVVGNLLLDSGQWHVIDWDGLGMVDVPFYDLITLLYSALVTRGETPEQWDPTLVKQLPILIRTYAQALSLPTETISSLLPVCLTNWFHLKSSDGCHEFAVRMYKVIQHYFEHQDLWERVFVSA
jgi:hypothetical protein